MLLMTFEPSFLMLQKMGSFVTFCMDGAILNTTYIVQLTNNLFFHLVLHFILMQIHHVMITVVA